MTLIELMDIAVGVVPLDLQTQRDGAFVHVPAGKKIAVVFVKGTGTDGDDPIITTQQAQDAVGTGIKALLFTTIWTKQAADVRTVTTWTTVTQAPATSYTNTNGHLQLVWVIEFDWTAMDRANGFEYLRITLNDTGTNAQLGTVLYVIRNAALGAAGRVIGKGYFQPNVNG